MNRLLEAFANWFASTAGVWQTFFAVAVIVTAEFIWPNADPHGFWVLYWLTVYSGVTQNCLAYVSRKAADKADQDLRRDEMILQHIDNVITERLKEEN